MRLEPMLTFSMRLNVTNIWRPSSNVSKLLVSKLKINTSVMWLFNMAVCYTIFFFCVFHCIQWSTNGHVLLLYNPLPVLHAAVCVYNHVNVSVYIWFIFKLKHVQSLGGSSMDGFSAIKITALGRPQFLVGAKIVIKMSMYLIFLLKGRSGLTYI